jgi:hypothetical protein
MISETVAEEKSIVLVADIKRATWEAHAAPW